MFIIRCRSSLPTLQLTQLLILTIPTTTRTMHTILIATSILTLTHIPTKTPKLIMEPGLNLITIANSWIISQLSKIDLSMIRAGTSMRNQMTTKTKMDAARQRKVGRRKLISLHISKVCNREVT